MFAFATLSACITFLATRQPKGPQPATYGHIQTLANLIDKWPVTTTMWWGEKKVGAYEQDDGQYVYHAGG